MSSAKPRQPTRRGPQTGRIISAAEFRELQAGVDSNRNDKPISLQQLPSLHEQARRHGYEQGITSAMRDVVAATKELKEFRDDRQAWLESLAFAVLRKILGNEDADDLVARIAADAIEQCDRNLETIAVHVHPNATKAVTERLKKAKRANIDVDVIGDEGVAETGCEVHTPFGIIDAGLDTQLDALEALLATGTALDEAHDDGRE